MSVTERPHEGTDEGTATTMSETAPERTTERDTASRPAPFLLLAAVVAVLVPARAAARPLEDIDLYWHILIGREVLAGTPVAEAGRGWSFAPVPDTWISTQWLAEILFAWLHDTFGFQSIVVYRTVTVILALGTLALVTLYKRPARAGAWPFAVAGLALAITSQDRSQQLTYILAPLVGWWALRLLRDGRVPRWWVVLPLVVVWANFHGGWLILPMALGFAVVARVLEVGVRDRAVIGGVLLAAGCGVAAAASPVGLDTALSLLRFSSSTGKIGEWGSVRLIDWQSMAIALMLVTVVVAWALGRHRPSRGEVLYVGLLFAFGYSAWRSSTPACLMLAPAVTGILARALGDPDPLPEGTEQPLARTAAGLAVVGVLLGGVLAVTQTPVLDPDIPQDLLGQVREHPEPQRVLNTYNVAGPLLFFGGPPPHVLVAVDGRADRYGGEYIDEYVDTLLLARPGWEQMVADLDPTSAVLREDEPLAGALVAQLGWVEVSREGRTVLLRPADAPGW